MYKRTHIDIWVLLSFIGMRENVTALNTEGAKKEAAPGQRQRLRNDIFYEHERMRNGTRAASQRN